MRAHNTDVQEKEPAPAPSSIQNGMKLSFLTGLLVTLCCLQKNLDPSDPQSLLIQGFIFASLKARLSLEPA